MSAKLHKTDAIDVFAIGHGAVHGAVSIGLNPDGVPDEARSRQERRGPDYRRSFKIQLLSDYKVDKNKFPHSYNQGRFPHKLVLFVLLICRQGTALPFLSAGPSRPAHLLSCFTSRCFQAIPIILAETTSKPKTGNLQMFFVEVRFLYLLSILTCPHQRLDSHRRSLSL